MRETIGMHQATDKEQPSEMLARHTENTFMMKEHELLQPKLHKKIIEGGAGFNVNMQSAKQVEIIVKNYINEGHYLEVPLNMGDEIR